MAICGPFGTSPVAQWCFDQHLTPHPRKPDQSLRPAGSTFERCPSNPAPTSLPVPSMPTRGLSRLEVQALPPSWHLAYPETSPPFHPTSILRTIPAHIPRLQLQRPPPKRKPERAPHPNIQLLSSINPENPRLSNNIGLIWTVVSPWLANQIPPQSLINLPNSNATLLNSSHNPT